MRTIAVDDEENTIQYMQNLLHKVNPSIEFFGFTDAEESLDFLMQTPIDIAFLDIEMGEWNGLEFARKCKELCPQLNIIFITGYSQYTMEALKLHVSGYLMKPVREVELRLELANLRHPILITDSYSDRRVRIQTFGNFEIFVDEQPLKLPLAKCRECIAYLVDRKGARVTSGELAGILWEDKPFNKALRNSVHQVMSTLMKVLKENGIEDIIVKYSREIAINPAKVNCDYFRVLSGDVGQLNLFSGEYMSNYSWAEFTVGEIIRIRNKV